MKKHLFPVLMLAGFLAFLGCKQDPGGDPSPGPGDGPNPGGNSIPSGNLGDGTLTLSGTIYEENMDDYSPTYSKYTRPETIMVYSSEGELLGTEALTNGEFSIEVKKPERLSPARDLDEVDLFRDWQNPRVSPTDYNSVMIYLTTDNGDYIYKGEAKGSGNANKWSETELEVGYTYVDRDLTITLKGKTEYENKNNGISYTYRSDDTTLSLTKGWNTLYYEATVLKTPTSAEGTISISIKNPDLRWVINNGYNN
jgi:hypothetical protein